MDQHLADRLHRLLQGRHRAVAQDRSKQCAADAPLAALGAKLRHAAGHVNSGHHGAGSLGHHSRDRTAHDAEAQPADQDEIQHSIQHCRERKEFQRRFAVAHAFQPRRERVVEEGERRPQKCDAQVDTRDFKNRRWNGRCPQYPRRQQTARRRRTAAEYRAEQQRCGQRFLEARCLPRAERLAHQHARADAQAADRKDHKVHDRPGHALGGQRILPDEPPRNDGIHRIVRQLQPVPQQQRHRIQKEVPQRGTLGHITHTLFFVFLRLGHDVDGAVLDL